MLSPDDTNKDLVVQYRAFPLSRVSQARRYKPCIIKKNIARGYIRSDWPPLCIREPKEVENGRERRGGGGGPRLAGAPCKSFSWTVAYKYSTICISLPRQNAVRAISKMDAATLRDIRRKFYCPLNFN